MKITITRPPNHHHKAGFYLFRVDKRIEAIGLRLPWSKIDLRFWLR